jgi:hypothetical protein
LDRIDPECEGHRNRESGRDEPLGLQQWRTCSLVPPRFSESLP